MSFTHTIEFEDLPLRINGIEVGGTCLIGSAIMTGHGLQSITLVAASARDADVVIERTHRLYPALSESITHHCADEIAQFWSDYDPPADRRSYADEHRLRQHEVR